MARGINKVILVGTLGRDPEMRYTAAGKAIASTSLATNESWKDKNTGEKQERTEWHNLTFFGPLAEIAEKYLKKGSQIYAEGMIRTDKYVDKQGVEKYATKIHVHDMQMLGSKNDGATGNHSAPNQPHDPANGPDPSDYDPNNFDLDSDDLPF